MNLPMDKHPLYLTVSIRGYEKEAEEWVKHIHEMFCYTPEMLIIIEQETFHGRRLIEKYGGTWYWYDYPKGYNQALAYNIAFQAAPAGLIAPLQLDFRFPADFIQKIYEVWAEHEYSERILMGPRHRTELPSKAWSDNGTPDWHTLLHIVGREAALLVGGFQEDLHGWSSLDAVFERMLQRNGVPHIKDDRLTYSHVSHGPREWKTAEAIQRGRGNAHQHNQEQTLRVNEGNEWGRYIEMYQNL